MFLKGARKFGGIGSSVGWEIECSRRKTAIWGRVEKSVGREVESSVGREIECS